MELAFVVVAATVFWSIADVVGATRNDGTTAVVSGSQNVLVFLPYARHGAVSTLPAGSAVPTPHPLLQHYAAPASSAGCTVRKETQIGGETDRVEVASYNEIALLSRSQVFVAGGDEPTQVTEADFDKSTALPVEIRSDDDVVSPIGTWDDVSSWLYDGTLLVRKEHDHRPFGSADDMDTLEYDDCGRMVLHDTDQDADGDWDMRTTYSYDDNDRITEVRKDYQADGQIDGVTRYYWVDGVLVGEGYDHRRFVDGAYVPPDGIDDTYISYHYDSARQLVLEEHDNDVNGEPEERVRYWYNSFGLRSRMEVTQMESDRERTDFIQEYRYDTARRLVWVWTQYVGVRISTTTISYDCG